jgi:hypothetical protein
MNQLSFAAAIWLSESLVREMSKTLQVKPDARALFEVLLLARKELNAPDDLKIEDITFWGANLEARGHPVIQSAP